MEDDDAVKPWRGGDTYVDQGWERGGREGGAGGGGGGGAAVVCYLFLRLCKRL